MAANQNFRIVISATDRATSSIRKVNESMSRLTRPYQDLRRSVRSVTQEIGKNGVVRSLQSVSRVASHAALSVAKIAAPLGVLTGMGTVAGISRMVNEVGRLGFELTKNSALLGANASNLRKLQAAGQLAGVSAEEVTGGLNSLRQNLTDAKWGRNTPVQAMMDRLSLDFRMTADGSIDAIRSLRDVAKAVEAQPTLDAKHTVANVLGIPQLLPLLMKGEQGLSDLEQQVKRLGLVVDEDGIKAASEYGKTINQLGISLDGLQQRVGKQMMPALKPLAETMIDLSNHTSSFEVAIGKLANTMKGINPKSLSNDLQNLNPLKYTFGGVPRIAYDLWNRNSSAGTRDVSGTISGSNGVASAVGSAGKILPMGLRNNNPGNLRNWGATPVVNGYAAFPSAAAGILAMSKQLGLYGKRGINTVSGIVSKWAPESGGNPTGSYIDNVSKETGFQPNQPLNMADANVLTSLISAMIRQENGQQPYSKEMIQSMAQQSLEITLHGLPQSVTATARTASGSTVKVLTGMPVGSAP